MAAVTLFLVKTLICVFILFTIKKQHLASANSVCYSFNQVEVRDVDNSHLVSSLWQYRVEKGLFIRPKHVIKILLLLAGDIEVCPGPCQKCGICSKSMRKNQSCKLCSGCGNKFHMKCLFDVIRNGTEKLYCALCYEARDTAEPEPGVQNIYTDVNNFLKSRGLKFFHQNVNGLFRKLESVKILLEDTNKNIHIFGISETHLNNNMSSSQLSIDGYDFIRKDRISGGTGGGVGCYIRKDINWQRRTDLESNEIEGMWIEMFIQKSCSLLICILYRPPDTSKHLSNDFEDQFDVAIETSILENKETIVMGDINCNFLKKSDHKTIKDILERNGLKQVIKSATRITNDTKTLIDVL